MITEEEESIASGILPCPFCGWDEIRVMEAKARKGILKGSLYTYCWCKVCGAQGPSAYNIEDAIEDTYRQCINRWNERRTRKILKK